MQETNFPDPRARPDPDVAMAAEAIAALRDRDATVATAESLTGGGLCAALTSVPGASAVVLGGVVSYDTTIKSRMLDVPADLLAARGAVDPEVAAHMAEGLARRFDSDFTVATTGAAGPDCAPGGTDRPDVDPGTVYIAVHGPAGTVVERLHLRGSRDDIRAQTIRAALLALTRQVRLAGEG